jgi:hypothetical protein
MDQNKEGESVQTLSSSILVFYATSFFLKMPSSKDTIWQTGLERKIQQSVAYRRHISLTETGSGLG